MEITRKALREFREEFNDAVSSLQEKHEIAIEAGSMSYNEDGFRFKVEVINGNAEDAERNKFIATSKKYKWKYPLISPQVYGLEVELEDLGDCRLVGIKPRSTKYPMILKQVSTGKKYKYSYNALAKHFKGMF